jgi:hypothetical protein
MKCNKLDYGCPTRNRQVAYESPVHCRTREVFASFPNTLINNILFFKKGDERYKTILCEVFTKYTLKNSIDFTRHLINNFINMKLLPRVRWYAWRKWRVQFRMIGFMSISVTLSLLIRINTALSLIYTLPLLHTHQDSPSSLVVSWQRFSTQKLALQIVLNSSCYITFNHCGALELKINLESLLQLTTNS